MGRLFDGVSAILGIRKKSTFEGEASTALQFAAEHYVEECGKQYEKLVGNVDKILFHTQAASDTENGTVISVTIPWIIWNPFIARTKSKFD